MKIFLNLEFELIGTFEEVQIDGGDVTIRSLLDKARSERVRGIELVDSMLKEAPLGMFTVSVNGGQYQFLPDVLDAPLNDGDRVEFSLALLGGG